MVMWLGTGGVEGGASIADLVPVLVSVVAIGVTLLVATGAVPNLSSRQRAHKRLMEDAEVWRVACQVAATRPTASQDEPATLDGDGDAAANMDQMRQVDEARQALVKDLEEWTTPPACGLPQCAKSAIGGVLACGALAMIIWWREPVWASTVFSVLTAIAGLVVVATIPTKGRSRSGDHEK